MICFISAKQPFNPAQGQGSPSPSKGRSAVPRCSPFARPGVRLPRARRAEWPSVCMGAAWKTGRSRTTKADHGDGKRYG